MIDRLGQRLDALVFRGHRFDDGRIPTVGERGERQQRVQLLCGCVPAFAVGFTDHGVVADLHDSGFDGLDVVVLSGHEYDDGNVGGFNDINVVLADTDRLDDYFRIAGG